MFDNIGSKIKTVAQVVCWIGIICSVISGIVMMATDEDLAFLGFMIIVIGSLISWVSSFTLYGFGQLIENSDKMVQSKSIINDNTPIHQPKVVEPASAKKSTPTPQKPKNKPITNGFCEEIKNTSTDDLQLILDDQSDLYNENELDYIKKELENRKDN